VLDASLARGPIGRAFALGMFAGAAMIAAPLAALTLTSKPAATPRAPAIAMASAPQAPYYTGSTTAPGTDTTGDDAVDVASDAIDNASDAVDDAADRPGLSWAEQQELQRELESARKELRVAQLRGPDGKAINAAVASAIAVSRKASHISRIDPGSMFGVTPQYAAAMRAASPRLARIGTDELVAFKIHGVSPGYVRDLEASGLRGLSVDQLTTAAIHGVNGPFLRSMAAVGYPRLSYNEAVNMRIHGVTPEFVRALRHQGIRNSSAADVIRMRIVGIHPDRGDDPDPDVDVDADDGS
jgi:bla regulator protein blaR1